MALLGAPSDALFIRESRILTPTSPHELGHCLGLYHTHKGLAYNEPDCAELTPSQRPNCENCGDLVCYTPADNGRVNMNGYTPDLTNLMSYFHLYFYNRDHFTNGQGQRMRTAIANESVLSDITSNSCVRISRVDNVCFPQTTTITLSNLGGLTTTWTSSNNVQIISSNNSSATIRAINGTSSGEGWIQANLNNGISLREIFDVGTPTISNVPYSLHVGESFTMGNFQRRTWNRVHIVCNTGCLGSQSATQDMNWNIIATGSLIMHSSGANNALIKPNNSQIRVSYTAFNDCGCSRTRFQDFHVIGGVEDPLSYNNNNPNNNNPILIPINQGELIDPWNNSGNQFIPTGNNN